MKATVVITYLGHLVVVAKRIGAIVAVACLVIMACGTLFISTPTGQKALSFADSLKNFSSPQDMTGCITGGCQPQSMSMSLFP
jgi:hypothetical protein